MITDDEYEKKLTRMRILEKERKQRIFNDKQRLIGVDKLALQNQIREKQLHQQKVQMYEDVLQQNLNFYSEQAIQKENLIRHSSYKEAEYQRQIINLLLAKEQISRNTKINAEALANIPTDAYYNYFNSSSR